MTASAYLSVAEIADYLGVSNMSVYRLVHTGEIPSIRVGRSMRVYRSDFKAYLDRAATKPEATS